MEEQAVCNIKSCNAGRYKSKAKHRYKSKAGWWLATWTISIWYPEWACVLVWVRWVEKLITLNFAYGPFVTEHQWQFLVVNLEITPYNANLIPTRKKMTVRCCHLGKGFSITLWGIMPFMDTRIQSKKISDIHFIKIGWKMAGLLANKNEKNWNAEKSHSWCQTQRESIAYGALQLIYYQPRTTSEQSPNLKT